MVLKMDELLVEVSSCFGFMNVQRLRQRAAKPYDALGLVHFLIGYCGVLIVKVANRLHQVKPIPYLIVYPKHNLVYLEMPLHLHQCQWLPTIQLAHRKH